MNGNDVEVKKVEGFEPKAAQDMEAGVNGVLKSGEELIDLAPDSIQKLIKSSKDILNISLLDIKNHVSGTDVARKLKELKDNGKKAAKIPDDLKFFFNFVQILIMDVLELLATMKEKAQKSQEEN